MNARTARRKRIIRVRTVEHQMAEANLARATGELGVLPGVAGWSGAHPCIVVSGPAPHRAALLNAC